MDGEHHRDNGKCKDVHGCLKMTPFTFCTAETQRQGLEKGFAPASRTVTRHCQVWNQGKEQIHGTAKNVCGDRKKVPHQRRMEVRPQLSFIWDREQPVCQPDATKVHEDAGSSLDQAEGGHQLRGACERASKFCLHHAQDRSEEHTSEL